MNQYLAKNILSIDKNYALFVIIGLIVLIKVVHWEKRVQAKVIEVIDGDTVVVSISGVKERIRLSNIDAPEIGQMARNGSHCTDIGQYSRRYLLKRLTTKNVHLHWKKRDRYKRILGEIYLKGESINFELIKQGMAVIYWFNVFESKAIGIKYIEAMSKARKSYKGIWGVGGFYDPYKFRSKKKSKKQILHQLQCS